MSQMQNTPDDEIETPEESADAAADGDVSQEPEGVFGKGLRALGRVRRGAEEAVDAVVPKQVSDAVSSGSKMVGDAARATGEAIDAVVPDAVTDLAGSAVNSGSELLSSGVGLTLRAGGGLLDAGAAVLQGGTQLTGDALELFVNQAKALEESIRAVAEFDLINDSPELAGKAFEGLLSGLVQAGSAASKGVDQGLDTLAGDPDAEAGLTSKGVRLGIGLLPIVGNVQGVGHARVKYKKAQLLEAGSAEQEALLQEARSDCLIALSALTLELCTAGLSGKVGAVVKAGEVGFTALSVGKTVESETSERSYLPSLKLDFLTKRVETALQFPTVGDAVELVLRHESGSGQQEQAATDAPLDPSAAPESDEPLA